MFNGVADQGLIMPTNVEAERAVLGSLLLDSSLLPEIQTLLKATDFSLPGHQILYEVLIGLFEQNKPLELALIQDDLIRRGKLEESGGLGYIASLEQYVVTSAAAPDHAARVAEKSRLRRLIRAAQLIIHEASAEQDQKGEPLETEVIIDHAEKSVFEIGQEAIRGDFHLINDLAIETMDKIEGLFHRRIEVSGIRTFYDDLDSYTSGFHASQLLILAARPSVGKTAFALNIALQIAKGGKVHGQPLGEPRGVGVFSLEMSAEELTHRLLSCVARVSSRRARSGKLGHDDLVKLSQASHILGSLPLYIDDSATLNPIMLRAKARRLKARDPNLGLIIVDYLQLMRGSGDGRGRTENRQQEVSEISRSLKALARELEVPVLALSQLSRSIEQRGGKGKPPRPMLSDLRESGAIEQDADVVMFVHRERTPTDKDEQGGVRSQMMPEPSEIIIGKQRNGPIGSFPLVFIPEFTVFYDAVHQGPPGR